MVNLRAIPLRHLDPLLLFSQLRETESYPAYAVLGEWTVVTWDPVASLRSSSEQCLKELQRFCTTEKQQRSHADAAPFTGGVLGYVSYDAGHVRCGLPLPNNCGPLVEAHRYAGAVLFRGGDVFLAGSFESLPKIRAILARPREDDRLPSIRWRETTKRREYDRTFRRIVRDIVDGEYYQLNLTHQLEAYAEVDPRTLFVELQRRHPAPAASFFRGKSRIILSLSPESFVSIVGETIETSPIKGTRPRGRTATEDRVRAAELLASPKEAAELSMITDLLRNDIGQFAVPGSVRVLRPRELQQNPSVWHTLSTITGKKDPRYSALDVFIGMLPGGSVTGCPKRAAMKAISQYEKKRRGPYTGSFFTLSNNGILTSSILIRTIVAEKKKFTLGIGGGIVADSALKDEWEESLQKASPFLSLQHGSVQYFRGERPMRHDDPSIKLLDAKNPRARGVFETLAAENGIATDLASHLRRLGHSAALLGMKLPMSLPAIGRIAATVLRSSYARTMLKIVCTKKEVLLSLSPLTNEQGRTGTATFIRLDRKIPLAKALPYHREWHAQKQAKRRGFDHAILVDSRGFVTECAIANLFWVQGGTLFTRRTNVLPGITRAKVLARARALRIPVRYGVITAAELLLADEVFLTKSTTGITSIVQIGERSIGRGTAGKITKRIVGVMAVNS